MTSITTAEAQTRLTLKSAASTSSYYVMMVQLAELIEPSAMGRSSHGRGKPGSQNVKEAGRRPGAFPFTSPPVSSKQRQSSGAFER